MVLVIEMMMHVDKYDSVNFVFEKMRFFLWKDLFGVKGPLIPKFLKFKALLFLRTSIGRTPIALIFS